MEGEVPEIVKEAHEKLPHFSDGRIDYSNAEKSPTLVSFLKFEEEILLLKRSEKVGTYRNEWSVVAGYLDELKPVAQKVLDEVEEETGIREDDIKSIGVGEPFEFEDEKTTWIPHPALVKLVRKPKICLNWEHEDYKWVKRDRLEDFLSYHLLRGLKRVLPGYDLRE